MQWCLQRALGETVVFPNLLSVSHSLSHPPPLFFLRLEGLRTHICLFSSFYFFCCYATQLAPPSTTTLFVCLFVYCCYEPRKSLPRLPPWARSKTPGRMSTRVAYLFLRSYQRYATVLFVCLFVFFLVLLLVWNPKILTSPPTLRSKLNPWKYIHLSRVALPAVLPKVHHRPETLYVLNKVNTLQVAGLARISGLRKP